MLPKCSVFIATSLDGFIARSDGSIDWLERPNVTDAPGEDTGYAAFISDVDALVMGRNTFELVLTFPEWPYGSMPLVVLSKRLTELPPQAPATVSLSTLAPADLVAELGSKGYRHLYVDGGLTIQSFLTAGLIDTITITTIPVLLGSGIPLFGLLSSDIWLDHVSTKAFKSGLVQSRYQVAKGN